MMRIIIKPLGAAVLVGSLFVLTFVTFRSTTLLNGVMGRLSANEATTTPRELTIYTDKLENGWMERGWAKVIDYANASPAHGGKGTSIRGEVAQYEAVKIYNPVADLSPYKYLVLFLHGGEVGGQSLVLATIAGGKVQKSVTLPPLPANQWSRIVVPLSEFGVEGRSDIHAFWVQNFSANTSVFYVDDIQFRATPPAAVTEETLALVPPAPTPTTLSANRF